MRARSMTLSVPLSKYGLCSAKPVVNVAPQAKKETERTEESVDERDGLNRLAQTPAKEQGTASEGPQGVSENDAHLVGENAALALALHPHNALTSR